MKLLEDAEVDVGFVQPHTPEKPIVKKQPEETAQKEGEDEIKLK